MPTISEILEVAKMYGIDKPEKLNYEQLTDKIEALSGLGLWETCMAILYSMDYPVNMPQTQKLDE